MKLWEFIEYENTENHLVYKHPCQDFNTNTKVIVREGQMAIFLHNGAVADVFAPGRYTLSTENLPILGKLMRIVTGGENTFSAEVFFISTSNVMNLKWGTSAPMDLQDPRYKIVCKVSGCGESGFRITDPVAFFKTFVGTTATMEKSDLLKFFRSSINMHIKNAVSRAITHNGISILDLNSHLLEISGQTHAAINELIAPNGFMLTMFAFENLGAVENDPSLAKLRQALEKRAEMDIVGYSYQQERSFDVMETMAEKGGASAGSGIASTMVEAGIGLGMAGAMAGTVKNMAQPIMDSARPTPPQGEQAPQLALTKKCSKCGTALPEAAKFCFECGEKMPQKKFCMSCGASLPENARFCFECGAKI